MKHINPIRLTAHKRSQVLLVGLICLISLISLIALIRNRNTKATPVLSEKSSLVINTDKSHYSPDEEVYIQISSLDTNGKVLCDSSLELSITLNSQLLTDNLPISNSPTCDPNGNSGNNPDYYAYFKPEENGTYKFTLTNKDDGTTSDAKVIVDETGSDISVSRWGPTRLNSNISNRYPMIITVSANSDFKGKISDTIPKSFSFAWFGSATLTTSGSETLTTSGSETLTTSGSETLTTSGSETLTTSGSANSQNTISWDVDLKAGESTELKYEYIPSNDQANNIIGPITITSNRNTQKIGNEWKIVSQSL